MWGGYRGLENQNGLFQGPWESVLSFINMPNIHYMEESSHIPDSRCMILEVILPALVVMMGVEAERGGRVSRVGLVLLLLLVGVGAGGEAAGAG